jgi:hypothetical protein
METDDGVQAFEQLMRRDAAVAGVDFSLQSDKIAKPDVLAKMKGGSVPVAVPVAEPVAEPVPVAEPEPMLASARRGKTLRNTTSGGDIVSAMLTIRNQIKLYHWQTKSFADHKATDDLTAALDTSIDSFVEVYMGKYGRPKVTKAIKLHNFSANMAREFVSKQTVYLMNVLPRKLKKGDTDLMNIRDEILAELNKVRYLFTLQ